VDYQGQGYQPGIGDCFVRVYRTPAYWGATVPFLVRIDGMQMEKVKQNDTVKIRVPAGDHRIQVGLWGSMQNSETLFFQIRSGEEIGFTCKGTATVRNLLHPIMLERDGAGPSRLADSVPTQLAGRIAFPPQPSPGVPQPPFQPPAEFPGNAQFPAQGQFAAPGQSAGRQGPGFAPGTPPRVLEVRETGQFEEPLGEEARLIDNRNSPTEMTRRVTASREWSRTMSVGEDRTRSYGGEVGADWKVFALKGTAEAEVKRNYSVESGTKHVFEEEFTISVPEHTALRVILRWKRIWQRGVVRLQFFDGAVSEVPFQVVVNVTFDQTVQNAAELWDAGS
jgi:hypothetical protein